MSDGKNDIIFPVGIYKDVPYFEPPVGFDEEKSLARLRHFNERNRHESAFAEIKSVTKPITASFIYAHPPDYHGLPMLDAGVEDWKEVFRRFKEMHIDTVIFQAALWRELDECFYRSQTFSSMKCSGTVENMFRAAEEEKMHLYMGGYGSVAGWKEHLTREELEKEMENHRKCFKELCAIGSFAGMYFPSETAFSDSRLPEKEKRMNMLYRNFSDMVKEKDPDMKIIVSPATLHDPEYNHLFKDFWHAVLENAGVDIIMPQDCIGNGLSMISRLESQWKAWREVADAHKNQLWSHTEIFERRGFRPEDNIYPAAPQRVAAQLILTAPYVDRHSCWEALSLTSDIYGEEGKALREFMKMKEK